MVLAYLGVKAQAKFCKFHYQMLSPKEGFYHVIMRRNFYFFILNLFPREEYVYYFSIVLMNLKMREITIRIASAVA